MASLTKPRKHPPEKYHRLFHLPACRYEAPWIYKIGGLYYLTFMMDQKCNGSKVSAEGTGLLRPPHSSAYYPVPSCRKGCIDTNVACVVQSHATLAREEKKKAAHVVLGPPPFSTCYR